MSFVIDEERAAFTRVMSKLKNDNQQPQNFTNPSSCNGQRRKLQYRERMCLNEHYLHYLFRRFCEMSSLRGVRRVMICERRILRVFWACFISCAIILVGLIVFHCVSSYLEYHTVMQHRKRLLWGSDYPAVTFCTNAHLGITPDTKRLMNHFQEYKRHVDNMFNAAMEAKNYTDLHSILILQTTSLYNVNNLDIFRNITQTFIDQMAMFNPYNTSQTSSYALLNSTALYCGSLLNGYMSPCEITPFYDFRYRNCIQIKVSSKNKHVLPSMVRVMINFHYISSDDQFAQDAIMTPTLTESNHLYFHERDGMPTYYPQYSVPFGKNQVMTAFFKPNLVNRLSTPNKYCIHPKDSFSNHSGRPVRMQHHLDINARARAEVRAKCKCEAWWQPLDRWPLRETDMCGSLKRGVSTALQDIACVMPLSQAYKGRLKDELNTTHNFTELCSHLSYDVTLNIAETSADAHKWLLRNISLLFATKAVRNACLANQTSTNCTKAVKELTSIRRKLIKQLPYNLPQLSNQQARLWKTAFPKVDGRSHGNYKSQSIIIDVVPISLEMTEDRESLVRPLWSMISQLGGASSFIAGITFTLVAELIELVYRVTEACIKRGEGIVERGWMEIRGDPRFRAAKSDDGSGNRSSYNAVPAQEDEDDGGGG